MFSFFSHKIKSLFYGDDMKDESKYNLKGKSLEEALELTCEIAKEIVDKIRSCYTIDFKSSKSDKFLEPDVKERVQEWLEREDKSCVDYEETEFGFSVSIDKTLEARLDEQDRRKIVDRLRKSIKKYCELMCSMSNYFDLDDEIYEDYVNEIMDLDTKLKMLWMKDPQDKNGVCDLSKYPVKFVEGFICQGKTKSIREAGCESFEMSQFFRFPLSENKSQWEFLPQRYFYLFSLWGFFTSFYQEKKPESKIVIDRCLPLNNAFYLMESLDLENSEIIFDRKFFFNFLALNKITRFEIDMYLKIFNNGSYVNFDPTSFKFLDKRRMEICLYQKLESKMNFEQCWHLHMFKKSMLLFYFFHVPHFKIYLESNPYTVALLGGLTVLLPREFTGSVSYELSHDFLTSMVRLCSDSSALYDDSVVFQPKVEPTSRQSKYLKLWGYGNRHRVLIDDSYTNNLSFYLLPNEKNGIMTFLLTPIAEKDAYIENQIDVPVFQEKNDSQNINLAGISLTRVLDDAIDLIVEGVPEYLAPNSSLYFSDLGIKINDIHLRYSEFVLRSRFFFKLALIIDSEKGLGVENFTTNPVELQEKMVSIMPRIKLDVKTCPVMDERIRLICKRIFTMQTGKFEGDGYGGVRINFSNENRVKKPKRKLALGKIF